jgi:hypothetical protein
MCATFSSLRVRKLTGKPAFLTIADSESEAPRMQFQAHCLAHEIRAFLTHSEVFSRALFIACWIVRCSSGDSLAWIRMPRFLALGTFGLPIFFFIKL